jgi:hypothetical protein
MRRHDKTLTNNKKDDDFKSFNHQVSNINGPEFLVSILLLSIAMVSTNIFISWDSPWCYVFLIGPAMIGFFWNRHIINDTKNKL